MSSAVPAPRPVFRFDHPHWDAFTIRSEGAPSPIRLQQLGPRAFGLDCEIRYDGDLGLDEIDLTAADLDRLRRVDGKTLPHTDLASVPGPFRWWSNTYGVHSPAALIHDRFIGEPAEGDRGRPDGVTERHIDRYFRFMLKASGVHFFRRWLMWAAVAARTRYAGSRLGKLTLLAWLVATTAAIVFAVSMVLDGAGWWSLLPMLIPVPASLLWARQFGAGLIMAYVGVPCLLPPSVIAVPFLVVYVVLEALGIQLGRSYRYLSTGAERMEPLS